MTHINRFALWALGVVIERHMLDNTSPTPPIASEDRYLDSSGTVCHDAPCRYCGYNLRGLSGEGLCPECGQPVGLSLISDHLRFSDPAWLRRVGVGLRLSFWGKLCREFLGIGVRVAFLLLPFGGVVNRHVTEWFGGLILALLYALGVWFLTSPDPGRVVHEQGFSLRRAIRVATIMGLMPYVVRLVEVYLFPHNPGTSVATSVYMTLSLCFLAGEFAKLHYLRGFAERMPECGQARRAHFLFWAYGGCRLISCVLSYAEEFAISANNYSSRLTFSLVSVGWSVPLFVFSIMYIVLLARMAAGVRNMAREIGAAKVSSISIGG